jgi:hypothetical protein
MHAMTTRLIAKGLTAPAHFDDADIEQWRELVGRIHKGDGAEQAERDRAAGEQRRLQKSEQRRQVAKMAADAHVEVKMDHYAEIQKHAAATRRIGETIDQAASRFMQTPEGDALLRQAGGGGLMSRVEKCAEPAPQTVDELIVEAVLKIQQSGETLEAAIARWQETAQDAPLMMKAAGRRMPEAIMKAREGWVDPPHSAAPRFDFAPRVVGGNEAFDSINEARSAMEVYEALVREIRAQHPFLSASKVYARAYTDRRHADVLARERAATRPGEHDIRERAGSPLASPRSSSPGRP